MYKNGIPKNKEFVGQYIIHRINHLSLEQEIASK